MKWWFSALLLLFCTSCLLRTSSWPCIRLPVKCIRVWHQFAYCSSVSLTAVPSPRINLYEHRELPRFDGSVGRGTHCNAFSREFHIKSTINATHLLRCLALAQTAHARISARWFAQQRLDLSCFARFPPFNSSWNHQRSGFPAMGNIPDSRSYCSVTSSMWLFQNICSQLARLLGNHQPRYHQSNLRWNSSTSSTPFCCSLHCCAPLGYGYS